MPELPADKATGETKKIYDAIEAALGVRLVNLVYRHLATVPGALEWAWYTVGTTFQTGIFAERSRVLIPAATVPQTGRVSLKSEGLTTKEAAQVVETLDAYNRANPMNALSLRVIALALETGRPADPAPIGRQLSVDLPELLPMTPLDRMEPGTRAMMQKLALLTTGRDTKIVPSLFRHFAAWPGLLGRLADVMEEMTAQGVIDDQAKRVYEKADLVAREIYDNLGAPGAQAILPDPATRKTLVETIEIFPPTICRMIVIAGLLRSALTPEIESD